MELAYSSPQCTDLERGVAMMSMDYDPVAHATGSNTRITLVTVR